MVHELLGVVRTHGVKRLPHRQRCQRGNRQHLRLTTGEQPAAMYSGQLAHAAGDGAYLVELAPVGSDVFVQNPAADLRLHQVLERFGHLAGRQVVGQLRRNIFLDGIQAGITFALVGVALQNFGDPSVDQCVNFVLAGCRGLGVVSNGELFGPAFCHHLVDQFYGLHVALVRQANALQDHFLRHVL